VDVPKGGLTWSAAEISEKTYLHYLEKFRQLADEMADTAKLEEKTAKRPSDLKIAVLNVGLFLCDRNDPNVKLATEIMDEGLQPQGGMSHDAI
jgi:hypothetical protein